MPKPPRQVIDDFRRANQEQRDEPQWLVSQHARQYRPGDDALPGVRADASVEAYRMIEMLTRASEITPEGQIVVSRWAVHRIALRIAEIAETGEAAFEGM